MTFNDSNYYDSNHRSIKSKCMMYLLIQLIQAKFKQVNFSNNFLSSQLSSQLSLMNLGFQVK